MKRPGGSVKPEIQPAAPRWRTRKEVAHPLRQLPRFGVHRVFRLGNATRDNPSLQFRAAESALFRPQAVMRHALLTIAQKVDGVRCCRTSIACLVVMSGSDSVAIIF